jgi:hypothetical protein
MQSYIAWQFDKDNRFVIDFASPQRGVMAARWKSAMSMFAGQS